MKQMNKSAAVSHGEELGSLFHACVYFSLSERNAVFNATCMRLRNLAAG
jgi:hypothetical protein